MFSDKSNVVSLANQKYDFNQWDGFTFKTSQLTTAAYRDKMTDIIEYQSYNSVTTWEIFLKVGKRYYHKDLSSI